MTVEDKHNKTNNKTKASSQYKNEHLKNTDRSTRFIANLKECNDYNNLLSVL